MSGERTHSSNWYYHSLVHNNNITKHGLVIVSGTHNDVPNMLLRSRIVYSWGF